VLDLLPKNGFIFNMLPQIQENQTENDNTNVIKINDKKVLRTFVPLPPPTQ
jgi:hypothetical protein